MERETQSLSRSGGSTSGLLGPVRILRTVRTDGRTGVQGNPWRVFGSFCTSKRNAPGRGVLPSWCLEGRKQNGGYGLPRRCAPRDKVNCPAGAREGALGHDAAAGRGAARQGCRALRGREDGRPQGSPLRPAAGRRTGDGPSGTPAPTPCEGRGMPAGEALPPSKPLPVPVHHLTACSRQRLFPLFSAFFISRAAESSAPETGPSRPGAPGPPAAPPRPWGSSNNTASCGRGRPRSAPPPGP